VQLEIAEDVEIEVAKRAIASLVPADVDDAPDAEPEPLDEAPAAQQTEPDQTVATGEDAARR
jgi:hypothetical protein